MKTRASGPEETLDRPRADVEQAKGQMDYEKSQLDATIIRAPVTGTILERTAEKGELITAQFASGAEGGPRKARLSRLPTSTIFRWSSTSRRRISQALAASERASLRSTHSKTAPTI
jgi:multidrug efflux pump subunit AcrA (membrane-fusion protein)